MSRDRQALRVGVALLLVLTGVRLVVAGLAPLTPDEAYYWVWSRALAPGYLDHPPMVALWIRAGTTLVGGTALGVRLLAPLSAALGSLLLADAAAALVGGWRAGLTAAALLNATLLLGVGAVTMTPDTPLLFFWTATLWALARLLRSGRGAWWFAVGAAAGLALDSKYTAALLGAGLAAWLLATREGRRWLRRPEVWAAGVLAVLLFAPVIGWNAAHGWASFGKQGGRTGDWHPARALGFEAELLGGQIGLATPLVFAVCVAGVWQAWRRGWRGDSGAALLAWLTLLPAAVFVEHALGDRVQANWPCVLYPAAAIAACWVGGRAWRPAVALGLALVLPVYLQAAAAPFALPRRLDVTLIRMGGWAGLANAVITAATDDGKPAGFVAVDEYGLAAELAWRLPGRVEVLGVEPRWSLFRLPRVPLAGQSGLLVQSARRSTPPDPAPWASITLVGRLRRARDGVAAEDYRLYRVTGRAGVADAAILPHPGD